MANKLIIITDLGAYKAYRVTRDEMTQNTRLELIENLNPVDGHARVQDRVTDQAGRFPVRNGIADGQMSHGENHNLETEIEKRSLKLLAETITETVNKEDPDMWYLAANSEINQRVIDQLDPGIRKKLQKNVKSDLTKIHQSELLDHFS